jgi:GNAT superfamily N-acetyltransferase
MEIVQQEHPSEEEMAFIYGQLRSFNAAHTGRLPRKSLHIFAYGPDQEIIGGLFGDIGWGWLHIDILWVDDAYRKRGLGGALVKQAEAESLSMGVDRGYLETTDFQARPFYEKMGYEVFAELEDQPPGHTCYYMKKTGFH